MKPAPRLSSVRQAGEVRAQAPFRRTAALLPAGVAYASVVHPLADPRSYLAFAAAWRRARARGLNFDHRRRAVSYVSGGALLQAYKTACCGVDFSEPVCCASKRNRCTASMTSCSWARKASPRFCTHVGFRPSAPSTGETPPVISRSGPRADRRRPVLPHRLAGWGCHATTALPEPRSPDPSGQGQGFIVSFQILAPRFVLVDAA